MPASFRNLALALVTASATVAMVPSCADNEETIFIRQIQALRAPECVITADPKAFITSSGVLDLAQGTEYLVHPLVGNQLLARGDPRQAKAEANRVVIEGAEIQLKLPGGSGVGDAYSVIANGTVDPTATADPSYNFTSLLLIPGGKAAQLRQQIGTIPGGELVAEIRIFGHTLGGKDVETGIFVYPIRLCLGCLVDFSQGKAGCRAELGGGSGGAAARTTCFTGQDYPTDCRTCKGVFPFCTPCAVDLDCTGMQNMARTGLSTCNTTTHICN